MIACSFIVNIDYLSETGLVVDGEHGPLTEQAIEHFQEENEQYVDGIASSVTMNSLDLEAFHPS
ncbi:peptidoglycan-binding domain-containing protein [Shouchella clausii]|uniref:peptidoglycan-binding domain-containing protein n=1 Tax=Shouchella clausii TaxID=79880 RepID=UPI0039838BDC